MLNNKNIVICGDSFNIGIGCRDLTTEPYGQLLSMALDKPIVNLAKGSSTNFSIYLQAKYAIKHIPTDLVIISHTTYDRFDWFPLEYSIPFNREITLEDVNYHQYPPYGENSYGIGGKKIIIKNPMAANPKYKGAMLTENFRGIIEYWETDRSKNIKLGYYDRINSEPTERLKLIYDYAISLHEEKINKIQSAGMITLAHQLLKKAGIPHLILTNEPIFYLDFIDAINICEIDWLDLSGKYPDDLPSGHTSPVGHKIVFEKITNKLKENKWYKK
jgi:hypothetical protein